MVLIISHSTGRMNRAFSPYRFSFRVTDSAKENALTDVQAGNADEQ